MSMQTLADESGSDPLNRIWADDLLGRRVQAQMLAQYFRSAAGRVRSERSNFSSLAVDADYGEGKSFFLVRFAEHLSLEHPVAYVDAWAQDFVDEPLTALAATIEEALGEVLPHSADATRRWNEAKKTAGKIAAIAAKGALKRGAGLLITGAAVEGISEVLEGAGEDLRDALIDDAAEAADAARDTIGKRRPEGLMERRIAEYREGRQAIANFKDNLSGLIRAVEKTDKCLPIVVVVDELDRCRPTYAIRLLEQVKHLLDVPGIFFVFGLHGDQLARAVSGVYGEAFDGADYLKRFINRTYTLPKPGLEPLLEFLLKRAGIDQTRLVFPEVRQGERVPESWQSSRLIARYIRGFQFAPRDAHLLVDLLQTCLSLTGECQLYMPLLLPLLFMKMERMDSFEEAMKRLNPKISFAYHDDHGRLSTESPQRLATEIYNRRDWDTLTLQRNQDRLANIVSMLKQQAALKEAPLADPKNYSNLVESIGQFSQPSDVEQL